MRGNGTFYWRILIEARPEGKPYQIETARIVRAETYDRAVEYLTKDLKAEGLIAGRIIKSAPALRR